MRAPISAPAAYRDTPRPAEPPRRSSLFTRMTSGFRGAVSPQPMPLAEPPRPSAPAYAVPREPVAYQPAPQPHAEVPQAPPHAHQYAPQHHAAQYQAVQHQAPQMPMAQQEPRAAVRLAHNEEIGIDIPAFLRRQQS